MVVFHSYLRLPEDNYQGSRYGCCQVFGHLSNCLVSWRNSSGVERSMARGQKDSTKPAGRKFNSSAPSACSTAKGPLIGVCPFVNRRKKIHQTVTTSCPMTDTNLELFPAFAESPNHPTTPARKFILRNDFHFSLSRCRCL